ncbi:hypothetical protein GGX14DRAFT_678100 [Mycena pura]|uniref:Uncharacterized protein n=1 Tax=Mycena pura TaxID=153505 RepID=A0AAD6Y7K1_9AGAR|nr:hypothetical protein GGX14DRAFT_678100 [Mycena pura]
MPNPKSGSSDGSERPATARPCSVQQGDTWGAKSLLPLDSHLPLVTAPSKATKRRSSPHAAVRPEGSPVLPARDDAWRRRYESVRQGSTPVTPAAPSQTLESPQGSQSPRAASKTERLPTRDNSWTKRYEMVRKGRSPTLLVAPSQSPDLPSELLPMTADAHGSPVPEATDKLEEPSAHLGDALGSGSPPPSLPDAHLLSAALDGVPSSCPTSQAPEAIEDEKPSLHDHSGRKGRKIPLNGCSPTMSVAPTEVLEGPCGLQESPRASVEAAHWQGDAPNGIPKSSPASSHWHTLERSQGLEILSPGSSTQSVLRKQEDAPTRASTGLRSLPESYLPWPAPPWPPPFPYSSLPFPVPPWPPPRILDWDLRQRRAGDVAMTRQASVTWSLSLSSLTSGFLCALGAACPACALEPFSFSPYQMDESQSARKSALSRVRLATPESSKCARPPSAHVLIGPWRCPSSGCRSHEHSCFRNCTLAAPIRRATQHAHFALVQLREPAPLPPDAHRHRLARARLLPAHVSPGLAHVQTRPTAAPAHTRANIRAIAVHDRQPVVSQSRAVIQYKGTPLWRVTQHAQVAVAPFQAPMLSSSAPCSCLLCAALSCGTVIRGRQQALGVEGQYRWCGGRAARWDTTRRFRCHAHAPICLWCCPSSGCLTDKHGCFWNCAHATPIRLSVPRCAILSLHARWPGAQFVELLPPGRNCWFAGQAAHVLILRAKPDTFYASAEPQLAHEPMSAREWLAAPMPSKYTRPPSARVRIHRLRRHSSICLIGILDHHIGRVPAHVLRAHLFMGQPNAHTPGPFVRGRLDQRAPVLTWLAKFSARDSWHRTSAWTLLLQYWAEPCAVMNVAGWVELVVVLDVQTVLPTITDAEITRLFIFGTSLHRATTVHRPAHRARQPASDSSTAVLRCLVIYPERSVRVVLTAVRCPRLPPIWVIRERVSEARLLAHATLALRHPSKVGRLLAIVGPLVPSATIIPTLCLHREQLAKMFSSYERGCLRVTRSHTLDYR